jgi:hypothetical protein
MRRLCEIHAKDALRAIHLLGSFSKAGRVGNSFLRRRHRLYESPHPAEKREPTSGLENRLPEGSSYEALQGFAWACTPPISTKFPFSGLPRVAPYCARGGVKVVSEARGFYTSPVSRGGISYLRRSRLLALVCPPPSLCAEEESLSSHAMAYEGLRSVRGLAVWYACAARSTSASSYLAPTICRPTGKPALVKPHGTDAAGCCVRLKG